MQQLPAEQECGTPVGVRQEAEMADLNEAGRQDVKQEPANELDRVERQELLLISVESLQRKVTRPSRISIRRPLEMATRCV
jgi:hypothetical protein